MVRMRGESRSAQILFEIAVRLVFDAQAPLFLHDFALGSEISLVDIEAAHAVGFEPEDGFKPVARKSLEEVRRVIVCFGVIISAHGFDDARMLVRANVRRTLEHEMFEKMREARVSRPVRLLSRRDTTSEDRSRARCDLREKSLSVRSLACAW